MKRQIIDMSRSERWALREFSAVCAEMAILEHTRMSRDGFDRRYANAPREHRDELWTIIERIR